MALLPALKKERAGKTEFVPWAMIHRSPDGKVGRMKARSLADRTILSDAGEKAC
jgi:hypothetical protein